MRVLLVCAALAAAVAGCERAHVAQPPVADAGAARDARSCQIGGCHVAPAADAGPMMDWIELPEGHP